MTMTEISELYVSIFNRASEKEGNDYWAARATAGETAEEIANAMLATSDATTYFGTSMDANADFVEAIYANTLNKAGATVDAEGKAYWVAKLDAGTTKGAMVVEMVAAIAEYAPTGAKYDATDTVTVAAYNQFDNRVTVSDDAAVNVLTPPADYATSMAFDGTLIVTDNADTVTAATALVAAVAITAANEDYTTKLATYDAAVVTAAASKAAADTAALDVSSVALADASVTAANTANTDATAVSTAAAALVTAAAATAVSTDDTTAATALTSATAAATIATGLVTTADAAKVTADQAAADAAAVGTTYTMTTDATDLIFGTAKSDIINAADATFQIGDIVADSFTNDNDTLTIASNNKTADGSTATVVGIENVIFNIASDDLGAIAIALDDISAASITINQLQAGASGAAGVTNATNDSTVTFGTGVTGATTVTQVAKSDVIVNAGLSTSVDQHSTGTATTGSITIHGGANTAGALGKATTGSVTIDGDALTTMTLEGATLNATTGKVTTGAGITLIGTTSTTDTATVSIAKTGTITNTGTAVETLNVSTSTTQDNDADGVDDASIATLGATNGATVINLTGDNAITIAGVAAEFGGFDVNDAATAGVLTTAKIITTGATADLSDVLTDVIEIAAANTGTYTVANNATVEASIDLTTVTFDSTDLTSGSETLNLTLTAAQTGEVTDVTDFETVNLSTTGAAANSAFTIFEALGTFATTAMTMATGAADMTFTDITAKTFDATGYEGDIVITTIDDSKQKTSVTLGGGDDTITATTAGDKIILDGGDGTDTLNLVGDAAEITFSNFEVVGISGATKFTASQLSGKTYAITDTGTNALELNVGTESINLATMDFSGLIFDKASTMTITGSAVSASLGLATVLDITGSTLADTINLSTNTGDNTVDGGVGADVITTGSGDDTITGGTGIDAITAGAGVDSINITEATADKVSDTVTTTSDAAYSATNIDTITGFTVGATGDNIEIDLSDAAAVASIDDLVAGAGDGTQIAAALVIEEITIGTAATTLTAGTEIVAFIGGTYADNAALLADIGQTAGTTKISWGGTTGAANDAFLATYTDGTNAYIVAIADSDADTDATLENADVTITTLATLAGITSLAAGELNTANFDEVA